MGHTACIEPQCQYKGALYLFILEIGTRWTWVGKFTAQPHYPRERISLIPIE